MPRHDDLIKEEERLRARVMSLADEQTHVTPEV
jgi:hypothetical protein